MDQEGIDAGSPRRPECVAQDLTRLFEVDISHHIEVAVEIAVADRRDDDISNLAMVDAGNLSWGLQSHPEYLCGTWGTRGAIRRRRLSGIRRRDRRRGRASAPTCNGRGGFCHRGRRGWA